ncbi:MAG: polysaccharide deacetylase family protein, partial [Cytophagaceae bacterium]
SNWNDHKVFFPVNNGSALPFDPFACSFYLVSRYAEYLPHIKDHHGRFSAEDSINFKGGFLDRPIVNIWAGHLKKILADSLNLEFFPSPYIFTPTIDINNAFAYKYKGVGRNSMALLGHLVKFEFRRFTKRVKVLTGISKDPYDTYQQQSQIHKKYNLKPQYFVMVGDPGPHNNNISHTNKHYITLIQTLDKNGEVCLHPSYDSSENEERVLDEKQRLEAILQRPVTKSRQHYVKINIPHTYRLLNKIGIKEDYSMGYASKVGFRAGTCSPFFFFDLEKNQVTELKIFPFTVMDTTLKRYLRMRSKEVIPFLTPIANEIKLLGGNFTFIFHNESLGNSGSWKHWGSMYENVIKLALEKKENKL